MVILLASFCTARALVDGPVTRHGHGYTDTPSRAMPGIAGGA
jgi:hypothetical protein